MINPKKKSYDKSGIYSPTDTDLNNPHPLSATIVLSVLMKTRTDCCNVVHVCPSVLVKKPHYSFNSMQWKKLIIHILSTLARLILPRTANVAKSANALASVTSGPRSSSPSCRSQALSSLRSDCQALRSDPTSRGIDTLVLHCTDTRPNQRYTLEMPIWSTTE